MNSLLVLSPLPAVDFTSLLHPVMCHIPIFQAAEKEAALAQQEEEKAEQRKGARAEKKALKKKKKTRGAEKNTVDEDDEKEWGDEEEGKAWGDFDLELPDLQTKVQSSTENFLLNHLRSCLRGAHHPSCPHLLCVGVLLRCSAPRP